MPIPAYRLANQSVARRLFEMDETFVADTNGPSSTSGGKEVSACPVDGYSELADQLDLERESGRKAEGGRLIGSTSEVAE